MGTFLDPQMAQNDVDKSRRELSFFVSIRSYGFILECGGIKRF